VEEDLETLFEILSNKIRRRILELISEQPRYLFELSKEFKGRVTQPAILKHLKKLEDEGYIESFEVISDINKLPRRYYRLKKSIFLSLCLGDSIHRISAFSLTSEVKPSFGKDVIQILTEGRKELTKIRCCNSLEEKLKRSADLLARIDRGIKLLEESQSYLLWLKREVLREIKETAGDLAILEGSRSNKMNRKSL